VFDKTALSELCLERFTRYEEVLDAFPLARTRRARRGGDGVFEALVAQTQPSTSVSLPAPEGPDTTNNRPGPV